MRDALIFVYGTLCPGGSAEWRMSGHGRWRGPATAKGRLYRIADYPGFVPSEDGVVHGTLFEADDPETLLAALDEYEECRPHDPRPHEYRRASLTVFQGGAGMTAWVYVYDRSIDRFQRIYSGDFLECS